jgi:8-oxo-(d)GTP phosphatase
MTPVNNGSVIEAAGGVLWRPSRKHGVRVALVRRPRYDDWSLPKGKADAGESAPMTAVREVAEETGFRSALGRSLTTVSYRVAGRPKVVRYFAARALDGEFTPNREVDRLEWLPVSDARERMTYDFDRAVLDTFALQPATVSTVLLVRHARAGQRESYQGSDESRPLDGKGRRQAQALVPQLVPFAPAEVRSAPMERCRATVAPLAEQLGVQVQPEPALTEDAYRDDPARARKRLAELAENWQSAAGLGAIVTCSQGGVIPGVVKTLAARADLPVPQVSTPKASWWVLTFDGKRLAQADHWAAPAV